MAAFEDEWTLMQQGYSRSGFLARIRRIPGRLLPRFGVGRRRRVTPVPIELETP